MQAYLISKNSISKRSIEFATQSAKNYSIILCGDFNLPGIDWSTHDVAQDTQNKQQCQCLLDFVDDFYFTQLVHVPTRCTPTTANTLDLILTTKPDLLSDIAQCHTWYL